MLYADTVGIVKSISFPANNIRTLTPIHCNAYLFSTRVTIINYSSLYFSEDNAPSSPLFCFIHPTSLEGLSPWLMVPR